MELENGYYIELIDYRYAGVSLCQSLIEVSDAHHHGSSSRTNRDYVSHKTYPLHRSYNQLIFLRQGSLSIGFMFNAVLYGTMIVQVYIYYSTYPRFVSCLNFPVISDVFTSLLGINCG